MSFFGMRLITSYGSEIVQYVDPIDGRCTVWLRRMASLEFLRIPTRRSGPGPDALLRFSIFFFLLDITRRMLGRPKKLFNPKYPF